jgi:hypothetical protein
MTGSSLTNDENNHRVGEALAFDSAFGLRLRRELSRTLGLKAHAEIFLSERATEVAPQGR